MNIQIEIVSMNFFPKEIVGFVAMWLNGSEAYAYAQGQAKGWAHANAWASLAIVSLFKVFQRPLPLRWFLFIDLFYCLFFLCFLFVFVNKITHVIFSKIKNIHIYFTK